MLGLKLREEFRGRRLSGTTIDFTNASKTGALERSSAEFLRITYPSIDLLKTIEAAGPSQSRPVVLIGERGQGKSHLMAALYHLMRDPTGGRSWLQDWAGHLENSKVGSLEIRTGFKVIAEALHKHRYKFLWDILFDKNNHPRGDYFRGKWEHSGVPVPGEALLLEMLQEQAITLILDEFQTWYEGLTNTKQYPFRTWAFNFIQLLAEIAEKHPDLLVLVVSVRDGTSDAAQQVYRVNPVRVDFKGPQAKQDRLRLLLYRIFENRRQIHAENIQDIIRAHVMEYLRLAAIPPSEHDSQRRQFLEAWPYAPHLMQLLEDQVLVAAEAQETRDLIRILVDLFKVHEEQAPVITAADFSLNDDKSGIVSLLDSVSNQLHRDLRTKALRNLEAVEQAVANYMQETPHAAEILSALWLRSLSLENNAGATPEQLQIDITRNRAIDDNQFQAELATIEANSFNIHRAGNRLVFRNEENPDAKLRAHAKNDKRFEAGEDIEHLAKEIRHVLAGQAQTNQGYHIIVLKRNWQSAPWAELDEKVHPDRWDNRIPLIVMPGMAETMLGQWLQKNVTRWRNTVRFLLPRADTGNLYYNRDLLVLARMVYLADQWKATDRHYTELHTKYQRELRETLKGLFDRVAVLDTWNYAQPENCRFEIIGHGQQGDKIPGAIQDAIKRDIFVPEEFESLALDFAQLGKSLNELLNELKEPRPNGELCIPWLGEVEAKESLLRLCASGKIAINLQGRELLQSHPGESFDNAWQRIKGKLPMSGRQLDEVTLHLPDALVSTGGVHPGEQPKNEPPYSSVSSVKPDSPSSATQDNPPPPNPFAGQQTGTKAETFNQQATSPLNLLGKLDNWGITPGTGVRNIQIKVDKMTGAQLQKLLKNLPDGMTYGLDLEKEGE